MGINTKNYFFVIKNNNKFVVITRRRSDEFIYFVDDKIAGSKQNLIGTTDSVGGSARGVSFTDGKTTISENRAFIDEF